MAPGVGSNSFHSTGIRREKEGAIPPMPETSGWQSEMAVVTPESVSFSYEVAGIGSRFLALLLDHLLEGCVLTAISLAVYFAGFKADGWLARLLVVGGMLFFYLGYFVFFEILWDGRSPGKRLMKLRVIRDGGYGLTALESVLRNLLRVIDFMPFAYFIGVIAMILSAKSRRLGDYVAGTVVVKDQPAGAPARVKLAGANILSELDEEFRILIRGRISRFAPEEMRVMREFLRRRAAMAQPVRQNLAAKLNKVILTRLPELAEPANSGERLIEAVVAAYEEQF
jgi:uncharacterized RDD family membrane protein YckC